MLPLDLRDYIGFRYPDKLSMDRTGYEKSELQRCCKNVSLRRYCSFDDLVLCHLELLTSTNSKTNYAISFSKSLKVIMCPYNESC